MKSTMKNHSDLTFGEELDSELDSLMNGKISIHRVIKIQDTTHIGTKLRNFLLKASVLLPFGNKAISSSHLKLLIEKVPKDIHG